LLLKLDRRELIQLCSMQPTGLPTCVLRLAIKKFLGVTAFWLSIATCFAGNIIDIKTPILVSHFSQKLKEPLYVTYALYKGGGDCSRSGMRFKNDVARIQTATANDYAHSGFDIGHLANAEDFASNCAKERMTFVFY